MSEFEQRLVRLERDQAALRSQIFAWSVALYFLFAWVFLPLLLYAADLYSLFSIWTQFGWWLLPVGFWGLSKLRETPASD